MISISSIVVNYLFTGLHIYYIKHNIINISHTNIIFTIINEYNEKMDICPFEKKITFLPNH